MTLPQRIVDKLIIGDCWEWTGATTTGYGHISIGHAGDALVHRYVYEALVGEIPEGLELDHLCQNPACCNPDHLEPVPKSENMRRGNKGRTRFVGRERVCKRGHVGMYTQWADGKYRCRACRSTA